MKPTATKPITRLVYFTPAVRFVFLCLIAGTVTPCMSDSMATKEDDPDRPRLFKDGQVIIGGFVDVFQYRCRAIYPPSIAHLEAISYTIDQINKNESLLPNVTLGYDIRDTCASEIRAVRHAYDFATATTMNCEAVTCTPSANCICNINGTFDKKSLSNNYSSTYPVIATLGALASRAAIPLENFLQAVRIPYVEAAATSGELNSPFYESLFFRTIPSDANLARALADIIGHFGWRYVGVIAAEDSYGRHGLKGLDRESDQRKTFCVDLLGYIPLNLNNDKLKAIMSELKFRETIRVVIVWSASEFADETLRIAVKEGVKNRVWILVMETTEFLSSIPDLSSTGIYFGIKVQKRVSEGFLQHLRKRLQLRKQSSEAVHWIWWKEFWKYVEMNHPSKQSNNSSSAQRLDDLMNIVQSDYTVYVIDAIYSIAHALGQMLKCESAKVSSSMKNYSCPVDKKELKPGRLIEYLRKVQFKGVTGNIQFDSKGDPLEATYDFVYLNITNGSDGQSVIKHVIGSWYKRAKEKLKIRHVVELWENDRDKGKPPSSTCTEECQPGKMKVTITECCWKCLPCSDGSVSHRKGALNCTKCTQTQMSNSLGTQCIPLPVTNIGWSDTLAVLLSVISVLGVATDVVVLGILWHFRNTPIVKALNKVCTIVLLFGIALCFGMTILHIVRPSTELCSVLKPLRYVVYTLCCSALFLKTMQIVHAFNISHHKNWVKAIICSTKRQVIVLVTIIGIEMLFGASWILLDPPYAHMSIFPKSHVFTTCVPFKGTPGKVLDSLMLVYLVLVAGCCIFYAFRARNLPANFNEAKHISFSLYIFLLSWITYYPVDYAAEGWYVAVLSGATLLLSSYGLLGCIFAPKIFIILFRPQKNTVEFIRAEMRQGEANLSSNNKCSSVSPNNV